jgi:hypothetical protein
MKYYKTLYLGTQDTREIVDTNDIILFDDKNVWSHAEVTSILSVEFLKASIQFLQKVRFGPRKVKLLITNLQAQGLKCNPDNKNTSLETIEWFLNNMVPPLGGIILSIYFYENKFPGLAGPWSTQTIWPLKRQWIGDGDYITVEYIGKTSSKGNHIRSRESGHQKLIDNIEKYCPYPVKYVSYKDGEEDTLEKLIHSKRHFTYIGGSYHFASMVNTPTVCYGYVLGRFIEPIYDIKTINWPDKNNRKRIEIENSTWGGGVNGLTNSQIYHFDIDRQICIQRPQTYVKHCISKEELLGYITFSQELEILHRDRKDWTDISDLEDWPI